MTISKLICDIFYLCNKQKATINTLSRIKSKNLYILSFCLFDQKYNHLYCHNFTADVIKKGCSANNESRKCILFSAVFGSYLRPDLVPPNPSAYVGSSMGTISSSSIFVCVDNQTEER